MRKSIKNISMIMSCIGIIGLGIFGFGGLIKSNALSVSPSTETDYGKGSSQDGGYQFKLEAYVDDAEYDKDTTFNCGFDIEPSSEPDKKIDSIGVNGSAVSTYFKVDEVPKSFTLKSICSQQSPAQVRYYHFKLKYMDGAQHEQTAWEYYNYCSADKIDFTEHPIKISPMIFTNDKTIIWNDENTAIEHDSYLFKLDIKQIDDNAKENANIDIEFHGEANGENKLANLEINIGSLAKGGCTKYFRSNKMPKFLVVRCAKYGNNDCYTADELGDKLTIQYLGCDIQQRIEANLLDESEGNIIDYNNLEKEITFTEGNNWQTYVPIANAQEGVRSCKDKYAFKVAYSPNPNAPADRYCKVTIGDNHSIKLGKIADQVSKEAVKCVNYLTSRVEPKSLKVELFKDESYEDGKKVSVVTGENGADLYFIGLDGEGYKVTSIPDLTAENTGASNEVKAASAAYQAAKKVDANQLAVIDKIDNFIKDCYDKDGNLDSSKIQNKGKIQELETIIKMNDKLGDKKLLWKNYKDMAAVINLFNDYKMTCEIKNYPTIKMPNYNEELQDLANGRYPVLRATEITKADWLSGITNFDNKNSFAWDGIAITDLISNDQIALSGDKLTIEISGTDINESAVDSVYIYYEGNAPAPVDVKNMDWTNNSCTITLAQIPQGIAIIRATTITPPTGGGTGKPGEPGGSTGGNTQEPDKDNKGDQDSDKLTEAQEAVVEKIKDIDVSDVSDRDGAGYTTLKDFFKEFNKLDKDGQEAVKNAIKDKFASAIEKFKALNSEHDGIIADNLPDYVKLVVEKIDENSQDWPSIKEKLSDFDILSAYDISLIKALDDNDAYYVVQDGDEFIIKIPVEKIKNADQFDEIYAKHIKGNGKVESIKATLTDDGKYYEFKMTSFSPVAFVGVNNAEGEAAGNLNDAKAGVKNATSGVKTGSEAPVAMAIMGIVSLAGVGFFAKKKSEEK